MIRTIIHVLNFCLLIAAVVVITAALTVPIASPKPPVDPPGPNGSMHVMFLTDHAKPLTQEQTDVMSAADVLDYEQTHCAANGVRRFDVTEKPEDVAHDTQFWRDAFAKHGEAPSVTIFTKTLRGDKPTVHPFPKDVAEMMEILTKAGGK